MLPRKDINKVTLVAIQAHGDTEIGLSMSVDGWTSGTRLRNRGALRCGVAIVETHGNGARARRIAR